MYKGAQYKFSSNTQIVRKDQIQAKAIHSRTNIKSCSSTYDISAYAVRIRTPMGLDSSVPMAVLHGSLSLFIQLTQIVVCSFS